MEITELLKICGSKDNPTVSGRALHEALEIKTRYNHVRVGQIRQDQARQQNVYKRQSLLP